MSLYIFLCILQTLQICSSILTTLSFFSFASYGLFLSNNHEFDWMPPFCFSCIVFVSWLGQIPISYIVTFEIFPKEVRENRHSTISIGDFFQLNLYYFRFDIHALCYRFRWLGPFNFFLALSSQCSSKRTACRLL